METCIGIALPDSRGPLSVAVTFVEKIPPVSLVLGLQQGKSYSEIAIVGSKCKCVCVAYHQVVIHTVDGHVLADLGGRNIFCDWGATLSEVGIAHNLSMMSEVGEVLNLSISCSTGEI